VIHIVKYICLPMMLVIQTYS